MSLINAVEDKQLRTDLDPFRVGDTVKVHVIIREGDKEASRSSGATSSPGAAAA